MCADAATARKCEQRREWPAGARETKLAHGTLCHRVYPYVSAPCNDTALWAPAEPTLRFGVSNTFNHLAFLSKILVDCQTQFHRVLFSPR